MKDIYFYVDQVQSATTLHYRRCNEIVLPLEKDTVKMYDV